MNRKYGLDEKMNDGDLITLYDRILDGLDRNDEGYAIQWTAISRRRDQIVHRGGLYSKKIKLMSNWYKPRD